MKAGSLRPKEEPAYLKPEQGSNKSLKANFRNDSEALYEPIGVETPEQRKLQETVERYNLVQEFLNGIEDLQQRNFASDLLLSWLPEIDEASLSELIGTLKLVQRSLKSSQINSRAENSSADPLKALNKANTKQMVDALKDQKLSSVDLSKINNLSAKEQVYLLENYLSLLDTVQGQLSEFDAETIEHLQTDENFVKYVSIPHI